MSAQKHSKRDHPWLKVYPFGGLGEVGMNMLGLQVKDDFILLDCGVMFPDVDILGLDALLPNFSKLYELRDHLRGLVITHGHEDHIGASGLFAKMFPDTPIYASPLTKDLILSRKDDYPNLKHAKLKTFHSDKPFQLGHIRITPVCVSHSIPNAHGFVFDTDVGRLILSGDFRYEYDNLSQFTRKFSKQHYFQSYVDQPIFCYFGDSTNVEEKHEMITEEKVADNLEEIIGEATVGLTIVTLFSSNMERMGCILEAARKLGKKVALCGRSVRRYLEVAQMHNIVVKHHGLTIEENEIKNYPRSEVVVIATGSQAEPRAALMRIAMGSHRYIKIEDGDRVLMSSKVIPGNERSISRMINALMIQGADVITEHDARIHMSGHAYEEESRLTLEALRPKYFIPIHGEYHHLYHHAKLARSLKRKSPEHILILRNGQAAELGEDGHQVMSDFEVSKCVNDFGELIPLSSPIISQRKRMARHGLIICSVEPKFSVFGLGISLTDHFLLACEVFYKSLFQTAKATQQDPHQMMRAFIRRYFRERFDRRPYVIITEKEFIPHEFP